MNDLEVQDSTVEGKRPMKHHIWSSTMGRLTGFFKRTQAFDNREFDMLAEQMMVEGLKKKRYVFSKDVWLNAVASNNRIVFSRELYDALTPEERLALAAHEFGHIKEHHQAIMLKRTLAPSVFLAIPLLLLGVAVFGLVGVLFYVFGVCLLIISMRYITSAEYLELEADSIAAYYVNPIFLETGLLKGKKLRATARKPIEERVRRFFGPRSHPPIELRIQNLRSLAR